MCARAYARVLESAEPFCENAAQTMTHLCGVRAAAAGVDGGEAGVDADEIVETKYAANG